MQLNFILTIIDRAKAEFVTSIYEELEIPLVLAMLGRDTNAEEQLDKYGFQSEEKAIVAAVADSEKTNQLIKNVKRKLFIDVPGYGMMLGIPIKSVGGGRTLAYLTNDTVHDNEKVEMKFE